MKRNFDPLEYGSISLLSCMTLDVENLRSVVHHKKQVSTAFRYARDFGSTAKEGLKHTTSWSGLLHKPWVIVPSFGKIVGPFWNTINPTSFSYQSHPRRNFNDARVDKSAWVFCATEKCTPGNHHGKGWHAPRLPISKGNPGWRKKISLQSSNNVKTGETDDEQRGTVEDEVTEFHSSSDEESCAGESLVDEESDLGNLQITRDVDFLIGTTSRFGRSVRLNSRFIF